MKKTTLLTLSFALLGGLAIGSIVSSNFNQDVKAVFATEPSDSLEGEGTEDSPYLIGSVSDLLKFRDIVNDEDNPNLEACATLTQDIIFTGENNWTTSIVPFTDSAQSKRYEGIFEGNGHTISGLHQSLTTSFLGTGFIGYVGGGTVRNLNFDNCYISAAMPTDIANSGVHIGIVSSFLSNKRNDNTVRGLIENVHVKDATILVSSDASKKGGSIGGLVACYNPGGSNAHSGIKKCSTSGSITVSPTTSWSIGGIIGKNYCYYSSIEGCLSNMDITSSALGPIGGIAGYAYCSIRNSYYTGSIVGYGVSNTSIGGIYGQYYGSASRTDATNNHFYGQITAASGAYVGAIAGRTSDTVYSTIENNYYLYNANYKGACNNNGQIDDAEGHTSPLTVDEFKDTSNFNGWDFLDTWEIINTDYPVFKTYESASYISRSWDSTNNVVKDTLNFNSSCNLVMNTTTSFANDRWYVVNSDVTIDSRISVNGTAHLIICDGCTLTVNNGIAVHQGNTLNIYGQSAGTGKIVATLEDLDEADNYNAAIGGKEDVNVGNIYIHGGNLEVQGGSEGSGIGSGAFAEGTPGDIVIFGGKVSARGGNNAAGIGGGANGSAGTVNVYGGSVTANGGSNAAGIGGGSGGNGGTVNVYGGSVIANGGSNAAGIGGGYEHTSHGTLEVYNSGLGVYGDGQSPAKTARTDYTSNRWQYMAVRLPHVHDWSYTADGASIIAVCNGEGDCQETNLVLTLEAQELTYDGTAQTVSFVSGYSEVAFDNPTISYYQDNVSIAECIDAGTYEARVTIEGETAVLEFNIAQATPTGYDIPDDLEATYGDTLSSVTLPSNWVWNDPTSTVGNVGSNNFEATYTPTDPNYKVVVESLEVVVSQATPTGYDVPTGIKATIGDTLEDVTLPANWSWKTPTESVGTLGDHEFVAIYTPTDPNYKSVEELVTVTVEKLTPTYDKPTGLNATYGDTLSNVTLPANWSWKNPNDKVGNVGENNFVAIYTPTDPNYKVVEDTLTVTVNKATPTGYVVPTNIEAPYDVALSTVTLPEGFSWMDGTQKTSTWGENTFKVKFTPSDTTNYIVVENIDVKVNVKWILVDPTEGDVSVSINDGGAGFSVNISVKVEIKTDVTVDEKRNQYSSLADGYVSKYEDVAAIYAVKLIRTTNGVEEEIQPSDIKEGTKITVSMAIPDELVGKRFRLLHIHNAKDITEVRNYNVSEDGKTLSLEVDRLSDFAFITAAKGDNGFRYSTGFPLWIFILLAFVGLEIVFIGVAYIPFISPLYYVDRKKNKVRRVIKLEKRNGSITLLSLFLTEIDCDNKHEIFKKKQDALDALNK